MFLELAMQLLSILHQKEKLSDDDFGLMRALSSYTELHTRAAIKLLEMQLQSEGFTTDDLKGFTP